jgi:hypothetical protein
MYSHAFATLALAEVYGVSRRTRVKEKLQDAVEFTVKCQNKTGGWRYVPFTNDSDMSVTVCQIVALRAARNVGIQVDGTVIGRAEDYVVRLQKPDGTFRYTLDDPRSTLALTAAAISTLNATGKYDTNVIKDGVDAIWSGLGLREQAGGRKKKSDFPYYERFYTAQAFWQLSDRSNFKRWYTPEREQMILKQKSDGSWRSPRYGSCYATAVNCLVLAIPEGVLPIFQR